MAILIDEICRKRGVKFINVDVRGPWGYLFNDFGEEFEVIDKNGEDPIEVMIEDISNAEKGVVRLLKGTRNPYEDGDSIIIRGVEGMQNE